MEVFLPVSLWPEHEDAYYEVPGSLASTIDGVVRPPTEVLSVRRRQGLLAARRLGDE